MENKLDGIFKRSNKVKRLLSTAVWRKEERMKRICSKEREVKEIEKIGMADSTRIKKNKREMENGRNKVKEEIRKLENNIINIRKKMGRQRSGYKKKYRDIGKKWKT